MARLLGSDLYADPKRSFREVGKPWLDFYLAQTFKFFGELFDLLGRQVRTLYKGKSRTGVNFFEWSDALNDSGTHVATGVYICRLTAPGFTTSRKILYIK